MIGNEYFNNTRQHYSATVVFGDGMAGAKVIVYAVKPLKHHEQGIKKGSRNMFFVYGVVRPPRQVEAPSAYTS